MRQLFVTAALVAIALLTTFGVGAYLEHNTFRAGPEPSVFAPAGPTPPPPGERRGRTRHVV